jgi:hypothetical protein
VRGASKLKSIVDTFASKRLLNRELTPDLVMTDHLVPGVFETELARLLRGRRPWIKTLVVR